MKEWYELVSGGFGSIGDTIAMIRIVSSVDMSPFERPVGLITLLQKENSSVELEEWREARF